MECFEIYKKEYSKKKLKLGLTESEEKAFYGFWFCHAGKAYLTFRSMHCSYCLAMTIWFQVHLATNLPQQVKIGHLYLTEWGDVITTMYLLCFVMLVLCGGLLNYETDHTLTRVLRSSTWVLWSIASVFELTLTPIYWAFPACTDDTVCKHTFLNIHRHGLNLALLFVDVSISGFPLRLLHFVYPIIAGLLYCVVSAIAHVYHGVPPLYPILDWKGNAAKSAVISFAVAACMPVVVQHFWFLLYILRRRLYLKASEPAAAIDGNQVSDGNLMNRAVTSI